MYQEGVFDYDNKKRIRKRKLIMVSFCIVYVVGIVAFAVISTTAATKSSELNSSSLVHQTSCSNSEAMVYLGTGYDVRLASSKYLNYHGHEDSGIKLGINQIPRRVIETPIDPESQCYRGEKLFKAASPVSSTKLFSEITLSDYQNKLLEEIHIHEESKNTTRNFIGNAKYHSITERLNRGIFQVSNITVELKEILKLSLNADSVRIHPEFAAALCDLPDIYDYEKYAKLLEEFGTHVIVSVSIVDAVIETVEIYPNDVFNYLVDTNAVQVNCTSLSVTPKSFVNGFDVVDLGHEIIQNIGKLLLGNNSAHFVVNNYRDAVSPSALRSLNYFVDDQFFPESAWKTASCRRLKEMGKDPNEHIRLIRSHLERAYKTFTTGTNETSGKTFYTWDPEFGQQNKINIKNKCQELNRVTESIQHPWQSSQKTTTKKARSTVDSRLIFRSMLDLMLLKLAG